MLQILQFIASCIGQLASALFRIDLGGISLGLLMCFCFILLPITHRVLCFIRQDAVDELVDLKNEKIYRRNAEYNLRMKEREKALKRRHK